MRRPDLHLAAAAVACPALALVLAAAGGAAGLRTVRGTVAFTGALRSGAAVEGTGTGRFRTALRGGRLRPIGTGTGILWDDLTLPFIGGSQEGTGI